MRVRESRNILRRSALAAVCCAALGCSSSPTTEKVEVTTLHGDRKSSTTQPAAKGTHANSDVDALTKLIAEQTARVDAAMARGGTAAEGTPAFDDASPAPAAAVSVAKPMEVMWIDPPATPAPAQPAPKTADAAKTTKPAPPAPAKPATPPSAAERDALLARLMEQVKTGQDPAMVRALSVATLKALDSGKALDADDLKSLTEEQREQVARYHELVRQLMSQLAAGGKAADSERLMSDLQSLIASGHGLKIRQVRLCRRVNGFGVYDAFERNIFLAGREAPMIVYAELDRFRSVKTADDQYTVRLSQEIVLYNESDGLAVWKQPAVDVVDQSKNQRRDFFVVQLIRLPARLTVGKYVLKVRVTDTQAGGGGSLDESSVPIQVVADPALVTASPKK